MNSHERFRAICLALPNTKETFPWGEPHFRVGEKIFSGCSFGGGDEWSFGVKLEKGMQAELVASDARFAVAPYVGKHGWVQVRPGANPDWDEVATLVECSYRLIAPKKLVAMWEGGAAAVAAAAPKSGASARGGAKARPKQATTKQATTAARNTRRRSKAR